jgi:nitrogen fixation/metabolism regulation signal transduction histidine kinase
VAAFRTLQRTILVAILLGIALALASAYVLARHIARPVQQLARATRKVQDGDYWSRYRSRARTRSACCRGRSATWWKT